MISGRSVAPEDQSLADVHTGQGLRGGTAGRDGGPGWRPRAVVLVTPPGIAATGTVFRVGDGAARPSCHLFRPPRKSSAPGFPLWAVRQLHIARHRGAWRGLPDGNLKCAFF